MYALMEDRFMGSLLGNNNNIEVTRMKNRIFVGQNIK